MTQTLHPIDIVDPAESAALASAGRCQCAVCQTVINAAAVVYHEADWDPIQKCDVVLRQMYCPHCQDIQAWREMADEYGMPTGMVLDDKPGRIKGRKQVDAFLRRYPQAAGVMQR